MESKQAHATGWSGRIGIRFAEFGLPRSSGMKSRCGYVVRARRVMAHMGFIETNRKGGKRILLMRHHWKRHRTAREKMMMRNQQQFGASRVEYPDGSYETMMKVVISLIVLGSIVQGLILKFYG